MLHMDMRERINDMRNKTGDEFDHAFMDAMIEHHKQAIEMAQLVETRSNNQELKDLAHELIEDQNEEVQEMEEMKK